MRRRRRVVAETGTRQNVFFIGETGTRQKNACGKHAAFLNLCLSMTSHISVYLWYLCLSLSISVCQCLSMSIYGGRAEDDDTALRER